MINKTFNKEFTFHLDNKFLIDLSGITSDIITLHLIVKIRIPFVIAGMSILWGNSISQECFYYLNHFAEQNKWMFLYETQHWTEMGEAILGYWNLP